MDIGRKFVAELIGTFWLVFGGVGSALFCAKIFDDTNAINMGIGYLGVSLASGLTVVTMASAIGHISGAHLNPAVTLGTFFGGRTHVADVVPYIVAQCLGGAAAAFAIWFILCNGSPAGAAEGVNYATAAVEGGFASNGFGEHSPHGFNMIAVITMEAIMTFIFVVVIMGCTDWRGHGASAGLAIGLCLALIHMGTIPISNCSVNPARSIATALVAQVNGTGWPLQQLWVFLAAPIGGGILGGLTYLSVFGKRNPDDAK